MPATNPLDGRTVGTLPIDEVFGQPGLAFFEGVIAGQYPMPPIAAVVPMRPVEATEGRIVFTAKPEARFMNPVGSIHAGYTATLLDTAMACAVHTTMAAGEGYTTLEIKCTLHRALQPDTGEIRVEGTVISRGRRVAASEARLIDGRGRLLASGSSTCMVFPLSGNPA